MFKERRDRAPKRTQPDRARETKEAKPAAGGPRRERNPYHLLLAAGILVEGARLVSPVLAQEAPDPGQPRAGETSGMNLEQGSDAIGTFERLPDGYTAQLGEIAGIREESSTIEMRGEKKPYLDLDGDYIITVFDKVIGERGDERVENPREVWRTLPKADALAILEREAQIDPYDVVELSAVWGPRRADVAGDPDFGRVFETAFNATIKDAEQRGGHLWPDMALQAVDTHRKIRESSEIPNGSVLIEGSVPADLDLFITGEDRAHAYEAMLKVNAGDLLRRYFFPDNSYFLPSSLEDLESKQRNRTERQLREQAQERADEEMACLRELYPNVEEIVNAAIEQDPETAVGLFNSWKELVPNADAKVREAVMRVIDGSGTVERGDPERVLVDASRLLEADPAFCKEAILKFLKKHPVERIFQWFKASFKDQPYYQEVIDEMTPLMTDY